MSDQSDAELEPDGDDNEAARQEVMEPSAYDGPRFDPALDEPSEEGKV